MNVRKFESPFQFVGNRIIELSVKNDLVVLDKSDKDTVYTLDSDYEIKNIAKKDDELCGILHLTVRAKAEKNQKCFTINLLLEGCFQSQMSSEEEFARLLAINGSTALYSIARSIILNISSQSLSGGQIILPMINVFQMHEAKEAAKNQNAAEKDHDPAS